MRHIAVIGAGIVGVTTAYALLNRGYVVTVLDRHRYAGMETSFANGGQLSASNAEVWNQWSTLVKGMHWMLKSDAPLLLRPAPSWHKYSWMAEFVANVPRYRENTIATTRLAIQARQHLFEIAAREGIDFDHEKRGILHIYRDRCSFERAASVNALLMQGGLERREVGPDEIRAIEPAVNGALYGGFFTSSDSTGDIHKFTRGLALACERRGARFIHDVEVDRIRHPRDRIEIGWSSSMPHIRGGDSRGSSCVDALVICAGIGSRSLAALVGDRVNIYPVKGYSITVHLDSEQSRKSAPWVSLLDDDAKIVSSRLGNDRLRVAGTAEFDGANRDIRADRIRPLVEWTRELFPGVDTADVVPWSGLRPMMPDMMPHVGPGRRRGVYYNTGHGHLGWTLSASTAEMIAENIASNMPADAKSAA